jgi:hypothetical protein
MLKERGWRSPINIFWILVAIGAVGAFGYYVVYPSIQQVRARGAVQEAMDQAFVDSQYPNYHATDKSIEKAKQAVKFGKAVIPQVLPYLKSDKIAIRQTAIFLVEEITRKPHGTGWGYDFEARGDDEGNVKAINDINAWYEKVKDDPKIK